MRFWRLRVVFVVDIEFLWIYFVLVGTYKRKSSIKILALTYLPRTAGILLYLILIFDWIFWRVNEICRNITCGYMNFCSKFLFFVWMFFLWRVKRIFLNTVLFTYFRKKFNVDQRIKEFSYWFLYVYRYLLEFSKMNIDRY